MSNEIVGLYCLPYKPRQYSQFRELPVDKSAQFFWSLDVNLGRISTLFLVGSIIAWVLHHCNVLCLICSLELLCSSWCTVRQRLISGALSWFTMALFSFAGIMSWRWEFRTSELFHSCWFVLVKCCSSFYKFGGGWLLWFGIMYSAYLLVQNKKEFHFFLQLFKVR
jgi:hypothetical protein